MGSGFPPRTDWYKSVFCYYWLQQSWCLHPPRVVAQRSRAQGGSAHVTTPAPSFRRGSPNRSGFIQISKTPSHEGGKFGTPTESFTIYYLVMVSLDRLTLQTRVGWVTARFATPRRRKVYKETFLPSLRSCSFWIPSWLPDGISQVVIRTWCPPNPQNQGPTGWIRPMNLGHLFVFRV